MVWEAAACQVLFSVLCHKSRGLRSKCIKDHVFMMINLWEQRRVTGLNRILCLGFIIKSMKNKLNLKTKTTNISLFHQNICSLLVSNSWLRLGVCLLPTLLVQTVVCFPIEAEHIREVIDCWRVRLRESERRERSAPAYVLCTNTYYVPTRIVSYVTSKSETFQTLLSNPIIYISFVYFSFK